MPPASPLNQNIWRSLNFHFVRWGRLGDWPIGHTLSRDWFKRIVIDFTFWFFFQGKGTLIDHLTGKTYPLRPGICLCLHPGMDLELLQDDSDPLGNAYFHLDIVRNSRVQPSRRWPICPFYTETVDVSFFDTTTRRILALLNQEYFPSYGKGNQQLEAEFLFKALFLSLIRTHEENAYNSADRHQERIISATISALYENPRRFRTVDDLAQMSGYSGSHFRSLCHKITGEKPSDLLIKARIEQAKNYLRHSELTIGMIADTLGYDNIFYFSRQFRTMVGMTASEYRKSMTRVPVKPR